MALIGTLTSGVSALKTYTKDLEVIGNNIANVNTTAFKSSKVAISEDFSNTLRASQPSGGTMSNVLASQIGTGVKLTGVNVNYTQGALSTTGQATDIGLSGKGFFQVKDVGNNMDYATRVGSFRWDDNGYLVTAQGYRVQGVSRTLANALADKPNSAHTGMTGGDIQISAKSDLDAVLPTALTRQSIAVDRAGQVVEFYTDGTSAVKAQIALIDFAQPGSLMQKGEGLYSSLANAKPTANLVVSGTSYVAPAATIALTYAGQNGFATTESGSLELSNVDLTEQFSNMITAQRSFQAASRLVTVSDNVLEEIVNLKR